MVANSHSDNKVIIVGAGPVGLTMASELARHGVTPRIIDKADSPSIHSKAAGIHARTLEQFEDMGIIDPVLDQGLKGVAVAFNSGTHRIARIPMDLIESSYSYVILLPQSNTEQILIDHLAGFGLSVERELELKSFEQTDTGVSVMIESNNGETEQWKTDWLIGCDGAHSVIRKQAGLTFEGSPYEDQFYLADVVVDWDLPYNEIQIFFHPKGILVFFPLNEEERRVRLVATVIQDDPNQPIEDPTIEEIQAIADERGNGNIRVSHPEWLAGFRIHHRKVPEYRVGRIFVAGDAAHIHSPAGGQGMNTGVQDAYNLAWKLALVIKGKASPALLDSYSPEREPVARHVIEFTDRMTRMVTLRNPVLQIIRNHMLSFVFNLTGIQKKMTKNLSEIDIHYPDSPIVTEDWVSGNGGLKPGDRAVNVSLSLAPHDEIKYLSKMLHGTSHQLLLFEGNNNSSNGLKDLIADLKLIFDSYRELISAHLILSSHKTSNEIDWSGAVLLDPNHEAHAVYGAESSCLYLIRPDGYIGYRSNPPDKEKLKSYLQSIFKG